MIVHICMISDDNYVMPTAVAMTSFIVNKKHNVAYHFHIVAAALSAEVQKAFRSFEQDDVVVNIIEQDPKIFAGAHNFDAKAVCVASISALFKFMIADLLPNLEKVLYIDGDVIARCCLSELYDIDLDEYCAAVVPDSGQIYYKHEYVKKVHRYFNSGVMVLNLSRMRHENMSRILLETKRAQADSNLMDQNVFNVVFNGHVKYLPIKYNFQGVSLVRAEGKWSLAQINKLFGTNYADQREMFTDAAIIHYSSKDKPWKTPDGVLTPEWRKYYAMAPIVHSLLPMDVQQMDKPLVSVIMPCYNVENYVGAAVDSILNQSYKNIELICLDDGSTDKTAAILKECASAHAHVSIVLNSNHHQGWERNQGIDKAKGKYIYFMDSDDLLASNAVEELVTYAEENEADLIYFEADSFYETKELQLKFPAYDTLYHRKFAFPALYNGEELYFRFRSRGGLIISPCLQFLRRGLIVDNGIRFPDLPTWEDNLFTIDALFAAKRVMVLPDRFYKRRVRPGSTMTATSSFNRTVAISVIVNRVLSRSERYAEDSRQKVLLREHAVGYLRWYQKSVAEGACSLPELNSAINSSLGARELVPMVLYYYDKMMYARKRYDESNAQLKKVSVDAQKMVDTEKALSAERSMAAVLQKQLKEAQDKATAESKRADGERQRADEAVKRVQEERKRVEEQTKVAKRKRKEVDELHRSQAYRTGMFVTWPARKAWGGIRCLRDNGVGYAAKRFVGKIARTVGIKEVRW